MRSPTSVDKVSLSRLWEVVKGQKPGLLQSMGLESWTRLSTSTDFDVFFSQNRELVLGSKDPAAFCC